MSQRMASAPFPARRIPSVPDFRRPEEPPGGHGPHGRGERAALPAARNDQREARSVARDSEGGKGASVRETR